MLSMPLRFFWLFKDTSIQSLFGFCTELSASLTEFGCVHRKQKIEKLRSIHWIVLNEYSFNITGYGYLTHSSFMIPYYNRTNIIEATKVTFNLTEHFLLVLTSVEIM